MTEPVPASPQNTALRGRVRDAAVELEQAILDGSACQALAEEDIQRLLAAATKIYVGKLEQQGRFSPFPAEGRLLVTATEVAATASGMLQALQIEVFELGMWQTQGGL
jgi:hypothetical protein